MTRSVLFDVETTGLDPANGDRIIEVAALELMDHLPTGRKFHTLLDPERSIPEEATRIHGMTDRDCAGQPKFAEVADALLSFLGDGELVAHNGAFDMGFVNAELGRLGREPLAMGRLVDTLALARKQFPTSPNSLDALCRRFSIDLSARTSHNALLDCQLLAAVYIELMGGRQRHLLLPKEEKLTFAVMDAVVTDRTPVLITPDAETLARHEAAVARLKGTPLWQRVG